MDKERKELFETERITRSVARLALPSVIGQLILVVYNMADTYFVGLTQNEAMITAVTVCMPAFMVLSAVANLFGIGGGAVFSRALGRGELDKTATVCSVSAAGCAVVTLTYTAAVALFRRPFLSFLGASSAIVMDMSMEYLMVTVCAGGLFTSLGAYLAHMVRAEGRSPQASAGVMLGGILNIALDPLFMFAVFPKEKAVLAVGAATAVSNLAAFIYYAVLLSGKTTLLSFRIKTAVCGIFSSGTREILRDILLTGFPAFLMTLCENISYAVLDNLMAASGIAAQAAVGVAKKINMLAHSIVRGLAQGVLPLLAYTYAAHKYRKLRNIIRLTCLSAVGISAVIMALDMIFAGRLVDIFLPAGSESIAYGTIFLRILCAGCPFSAFAYTIISFFQATGRGKKSFCLAVLRKGALDIPLMFLLGRLFPVYGIVAATPIADIVCCAVSAILIKRWFTIFCSGVSIFSLPSCPNTFYNRIGQ